MNMEAFEKEFLVYRNAIDQAYGGVNVGRLMLILLSSFGSRLTSCYQRYNSDECKLNVVFITFLHDYAVIFSF